MADRTVKLPEFSGDIAVDKMSAQEYISAVEMSARAGEWTDEVTAERVKLKLTGEARTWLNNRIRAETPGLGVFAPAAVNGRLPPGLRQLIIDRFMPQQTAGEQERLRATLIQADNESVNSFFDRVESVQFLLDMELPANFRVDQKASYDIVHNRQVQGNFIAGLRNDIRRHVTTLNVATLEDALRAAIAFEKAASPAKKAIGGMQNEEGEQTLEARLAALELQRSGQVSRGRGRGRGGLQGQAGEGCFYCGYVGHIKPVCRIRQGDEARGIFIPRAVGFVPGRIGRGRGTGRGNGQPRGGQQRGRGAFGPYRGGGTYRGQGNYVNTFFSQPQQQQQLQPSPQPQPQQPVVPQPVGGFQPIYAPQGSADQQFYDYQQLGALRHFSPEN